MVDGVRVDEYKEVATCPPDGSWESHQVLIEEVDFDEYYDVEFTAEINDTNNNVVGMAQRVSVRIDYSEEKIHATLSNHVDFDDEDDGIDEGESATSDQLFVSNSYCMRNIGHNGLEIYFPGIPNEYIRTTMREQGWRWHRQKRCWYAKETPERISLAEKITGSGKDYWQSTFL